MASDFDLTGQGDAGNSYAALPGTSGSGFVQHYMTPNKEALASGREVAGEPAEARPYMPSRLKLTESIKAATQVDGYTKSQITTLASATSSTEPGEPTSTAHMPGTTSINSSSMGTRAAPRPPRKFSLQYA